MYRALVVLNIALFIINTSGPYFMLGFLNLATIVFLLLAIYKEECPNDEN